MSSDIELQAAFVTAPHMDAIAAFTIATSSARTNLAAAAQLGPEAESGKFVTIIAVAGFYFFLNNADAGTVDETATSGSNRAFFAPAGLPVTFILRKGYTWLVHKAPVATVGRAYVSSKPPHESHR